MAEPSKFVDYADLMDVSFSSEYDHMENLDEEVLDDVAQFIIESIVHCKRDEFNEDFAAFAATLTSKDWAQIDECIQALNDQPVIQCTTSEVKNKRIEFSPKQITDLENEFSKCQSPDLCKCEEIAKTLKLSSRRVNSWFKRRRAEQESCSQPSSKSSVKLTLRLVRQSEDANAWSVLRKGSQDRSSSAANSSAPCKPKGFLTPPSMSHCSEQSDPVSDNQFQNTEFQDDILTAKRLITGRRSKLSPQQQQTLEEEFLLSQFISAKRRRELSESLGLAESRIKNWFEYRRRLVREKAKKNGKDASVSTTSRRKPERGDVSSMSKENDSDALSVCSSTSSFAWDPEDFQPDNSDFGSIADIEASSSTGCESERTTSWEDNEFSTSFISEENFSLLSSLGLENICPNLNMI